ncbi:MAG: phosphoribosylaminoimidazolesuccinocarboxamide synthase [Bacteroidota bacterium]
MERSFRTKSGFCQITDDEIILSRDGIRGNVAKVTVGIASLLLWYYAFSQYQHGHVIEAILFGALGTYLVLGIVRSLNNSAAPIIDRKTIRQVKFVSGKPHFTRSRFEVFFDEKGRTKSNWSKWTSISAGLESQSISQEQLADDDAEIPL